MAVKSVSRQKKKAAPQEPAPPSTQTLVAETVAVDYPQEAELIVPGHYAVRVSSVPEAEVEISINNGEWQPCRGSVGYYWFDWWADQTGETLIVARARVGKGRWKKSLEKTCTVVGSGSN